MEPLKVKGKDVNGLVERYFLALKENNTSDMNRFGSLLYKKLFNLLEKYRLKYIQSATLLSILRKNDNGDRVAKVQPLGCGR